MDGDNDGAQAVEELDQAQDGQGGQAQEGAQDQDGQPQAAQQVTAPAARKLPDYESQLAEKDAQIQELQQKVAEAAKTSEATQDLNDQIAALKQAMADERVEFALISAGARNVKAAKALLADHDGDVQALKDAEPWMFDPNSGLLPADSQNSSQLHTITTQGATGLEPAALAGGSRAEREMRHWEEIAGLTGPDAAKGEE